MSIDQLTKKCSTCQEHRSVSEFYKNRTRKDGLQSRCKICQKRWERSAVRKAYQKRYNLSAAGRATHRRADEKYIKRYPARVKARNAIHALCVAGKLPQASILKCLHCEAQASEYHHNLGYSQDHWLDVIPLCRRCHVVADDTILLSPIETIQGEA